MSARKVGGDMRRMVGVAPIVQRAGFPVKVRPGGPQTFYLDTAFHSFMVDLEDENVVEVVHILVDEAGNWERKLAARTFATDPHAVAKWVIEQLRRSKQGSGRPKQAKNLPPDVERYVKEIKESQPGKDDSYYWAVAWSRYCKYKEPGSEHCKQDKYFPGREASKRSTKMGDQQLRERVIRLAHGNPELRGHLLPILASTEKVGAGTDLAMGLQEELNGQRKMVARKVLNFLTSQFKHLGKGASMVVTLKDVDWSFTDQGAIRFEVRAHVKDLQDYPRDGDDIKDALGYYGRVRRDGDGWSWIFGS